MLLLLPFLAFLCLWLNLAGRSFLTHGESSLRFAALQTAAILGVFVALSSEVLSAFQDLTTPWVALLWAVVFAISVRLGWQRGWIQAGRVALIGKLRCLQNRDIILLAALAVPIGLLFLVALLSQVNNNDSLLYHLSRVVHWAQNRSLQTYASGYPNQISQPVWAEEAILQLRLLWGNDRWANLVQWGSMLGSLAAVTLLAKLLGAGRGGQLAAAAFALSIPMGVLESTSTQNDYVAAFWLASLACWAVFRSQRKLAPDEWLTAALTLGLGLLTKGTNYPAMIPLVAWLLLIQARQMGSAGLARAGLLLAGVVVLLNYGYWSRNTLAFGDPLGQLAGSEGLTAIGTSPGEVATAPIKNLVLNYVTPYPELNERLVGTLRSAFGGWDPTLADLHLTWGWNHEDLAGNPLHYLLALISLILLLTFRRRLRDSLPWLYTAACLAIFLMLFLALRFQVFNLRFQLSFLVVWAPVFGIAISSAGGRRLTSAVVLLLVLASLPWVFFNRTRPLISMRNPPERFGLACDWHFGCTVGSVLIEPASTIVFANRIDLRESYLSVGETVRTSGCRQVGLRIDSHDPEYLLWWVLDAPENGIRVESVYPIPELARFSDPAFKPCAVICTICKDRKEVESLPLYKTFGDVTLYMDQKEGIGE